MSENRPINWEVIVSGGAVVASLIAGSWVVSGEIGHADGELDTIRVEVRLLQEELLEAEQALLRFEERLHTIQERAVDASIAANSANNLVGSFAGRVDDVEELFFASGTVPTTTDREVSTNAEANVALVEDLSLDELVRRLELLSARQNDNDAILAQVVASQQVLFDRVVTQDQLPDFATFIRNGDRLRISSEDSRTGADYVLATNGREGELYVIVGARPDNNHRWSITRTEDQ